MNTLILDFDGTLADTRSLIVGTMQATLAELALPARTDDQCAAMIGLPLKETFVRLIPMDDATGSRCEQTYRRIFFETVNRIPVPTFPHVVETIRRLQARGYTLTIASSRSRRSLLHFLENMQLTDCIAIVLGADDVTNAKPHPEAVTTTLQRLNISAGDAIVVGDTTFDIEMGRQAGCRTCGVTYGNHSRDQLQAAGTDWLIDDFAQLTRIADELS